MKRILAHKIHYLDKVYTLSVATIDGNRVVDIRPFEKETPSTEFISGAVRLVPTSARVEIIPLI